MSELILHTGENCNFINLEKESSDIDNETVNSYNKTKKNINNSSILINSNKKKIGNTLFFHNPVYIYNGASIVSQREGNGPIGEYFDSIVDNPMCGEKTFEAAEVVFLIDSIRLAVKKAELEISDIDVLLAGDLLNQITTSSYVARDLEMPYMGLYSACSTMTQSLGLGSALVNAGYYDYVACATASHFASAERQFRYPLEYGSQRPPYAQWTVTGGGCTILSSQKSSGARIVASTTGKVIDYGVCDLSNMGAAMAPAAMDTLINLFKDTSTIPDDYDLIITGDLGKLGSDILRDLMRENGYDLGQQYIDCGATIYDKSQKCYQGGSGTGCCASVFNSLILNRLQNHYYKRIAFLATGALMSAQICYQGETMPCISHAIVIEDF